MKQLLLAATALGLLAGTAWAGPEISIGASTAGGTTITGTGTGNVTVVSTPQSGTATDPTLGTVGNYTLTGLSLRTFTSAGSGVWDAPTGTTATFTYTNGVNSLTDTWIYSSVNDGSLNPHFFGTDTVTAISGSAAFLADFGPVGSGSTFDYTLNAFTESLDLLALTTNGQTQGLSSGELVPNPVPEPATLATFGVGLLGLLSLNELRRRRRR